MELNAWILFGFWLIALSSLHVTLAGIVVLSLTWLTQQKRPAVAHSIIVGGMLCFLAIPMAALMVRGHSWQTLGGELTQASEPETPNAITTTASQITSVGRAQRQTPVVEEADSPKTKNAEPSAELAVHSLLERFSPPALPSPATHSAETGAGQVVGASTEKAIAKIQGKQQIGSIPPTLLYSLIVLVFSLGCLASAAKLVGALLWARRISKRSTTPVSRVTVLSASLAKQFGVRNQQVLVSDEIQRPMLWGFNLATIVLPANHQSWSDTELLSVLSHELAHASRGDHWTKIALRCVRVLYWYHPLVRWLDQFAESMAEQSADDLSIANGRKGTELSQCLLKFATSHSLNPIALQFTSYRELRNRIERLTTGRYSAWRIGPLGRTIQVSLALATSLLLSLCIGLSEQRIATAQQKFESAAPQEQTRVQKAIASLNQKPAWSHLPFDLESQVSEQNLSGPEFNVQVSLIDEDDNPVAGTFCALIEDTSERTNHDALSGHSYLKIERLLIGLGVTDDQGICLLENVHGRSIAGSENGIVKAALVVLHPEYGFRVFPLLRSNRQQVITHRMESGKTLSGMVTSDDGGAIADARLSIAVRKRNDALAIGTSIFDRVSVLAPQLKTKDDGSFEIEGLPPDHFVEVTPAATNFQVTKKAGQPENHFVATGSSHITIDMQRATKPSILFKCIDQEETETPPLPICGIGKDSIPEVDSDGYCSTRSYMAMDWELKPETVLLLQLTMPSPWVSLNVSRRFGDCLEPFEIPVSRGRIIRGRVLDADSGRPLIGLDVIGLKQKFDDNVRLRAESRTNLNGEFELVVSKDEWIVRVDGPIHCHELLDAERQYAVTTTIPAGTDYRDEIVFRLQPKPKLRGIVRTASGNPVNAGTTVSLSYTLAERNETVTQTNERGEFELLPPLGNADQYELQASNADEQCSLAVQPDQLRESQAKPLEVRMKSTNRKAMGRVVDANGKPISDAMILRSQGRIESHSTKTDRDGKFAIDFESDATPQEYLWIFKTGYNLKVIAPSLSPNGIRDCSVQLSNADVTKVSVILDDETPSTTAIVEHPQMYVPNGVYESNASTGSAQYIPTKISSQIVVPTKPDGCFEIRGIPTGLLNLLQVTDQGVSQKMAAWVFKSNPIKLQPTGNIQGRFVNYKNSGLKIGPNKPISLFVQTVDLNNGYLSESYVDLNEEGSFEVRNQVAGRAMFYFHKFENADWQPEPISEPTVIPGADIKLDIQLSKVTKAKGRVIDAESLKPTKAILSVFPTQPKLGVGSSIETDEDGRFEFKVPPGDWTLRVESRQIGEKFYEPTTIDFHVSPDTPEMDIDDIEVGEIALKDVQVVDTYGKPITKGAVALAYSNYGHIQCYGKLDEEGLAEIAIPNHILDRPSESFWVLYPEDKPIRSIDAREMPKLKIKSQSPLILTLE